MFMRSCWTTEFLLGARAALTFWNVKSANNYSVFGGKDVIDVKEGSRFALYVSVVPVTASILHGTYVFCVSRKIRYIFGAVQAID
jgi:hypothetical protein